MGWRRIGGGEDGECVMGVGLHSFIYKIDSLEYR